MWCFFQGHAFFHINARAGIPWGRLTVSSLRAGQLSKAAGWGLGDMEVNLALPVHDTWEEGPLQRNNPASHKSLCGAASIYNTTATAGTGSRCLPAGTGCSSLRCTAPTLPVPRALHHTGIQRRASRCWLPAGSGGHPWSPRTGGGMLGVPSPPCQQLASSRSHHRCHHPLQLLCILVVGSLSRWNRTTAHLTR